MVELVLENTFTSKYRKQTEELHKELKILYVMLRILNEFVESIKTNETKIQKEVSIFRYAFNRRYS